jgi:hypothetical protein
MSEERESLGLLAYAGHGRFHRRGELKFAFISNTIFVV